MLWLKFPVFPIWTPLCTDSPYIERSVLDRSVQSLKQRIIFLLFSVPIMWINVLNLSGFLHDIFQLCLFFFVFYFVRIIYFRKGGNPDRNAFCFDTFWHIISITLFLWLSQCDNYCCLTFSTTLVSLDNLSMIN
jgi:hypothetical protein